MTTYQTFRTAFDYMTPTTLVSIIDDATAKITVALKLQDLIAAAWDALIANVGADDAMDMVMDAGIILGDLGGAS